MTSLGASIPPELFKNILAFVGDVDRLGYKYYPFSLRDEIDPVARREEMRHLSACASTCVYWAQLSRPLMFRTLILRSAKDMYGLHFLLRAPQSPRIMPICIMLKHLYVVYTLGDHPWFHNLTRLLWKTHMEQGLVWSIDGIQVKLHITGPPKPAFMAAAARGSILHPLFFSSPRVFPIVLQKPLQVRMIIENIHLPNPTLFYNLLLDLLHLCSWSRDLKWSCFNLTWDLDHASPATPSSIGLKYAPHTISPFRQRISGCTDDILLECMVYSIPHHRLSQHYQSPHLTLQDTSCLFDLLHLTTRGSPALNNWSASDPGDMIPSAYVLNIYTFPLSHADTSNTIA